MTLSGRAAMYLPAIGPAPLRFAEPAPPVILALLPPLRVEDPDPNQAAEPDAAAGEVAATAQTGSAVPPEKADGRHGQTILLPSDVAQAGETNVASLTGTTVRVEIPATTEPAYVNPQMILQFFRSAHETNAAGTAVFVPVEFVPPSPKPPSSSAVYQAR